MPETIGDSSPAVTATIASSSSAKPSLSRPCWIRMWPCSCAASANRSESPKRSAIAAASPAVAAAPSQSPRASCSKIAGSEQVAPLDALTLVALEQPLGASEPAARAAHLATPGERDARPRTRTASAASSRPAVEVGPVGALEEAEVVVLAADHVRGGGEQLEVVRPERLRPIGC